MNEHIYNDDFFKSHIAPNSIWSVGYPPLAKALLDTLQFEHSPVRVWDMGCGVGNLIGALYDLECDVRGIEGSVAALPYIPNRLISRIVFGDILLDHPVPESDLVICTEVAEHVPKEQADRLVEQIVKADGQYVYFTAAPPGQKGTGHINEQPKQYWVEKFRKWNWDLNLTMTARLVKNLIGTPMRWYTNNSMIFSPMGRGQ